MLSKGSVAKLPHKAAQRIALKIKINFKHKYKVQ